MAEVKIISETPINMYLLKKELASIKKKNRELDFREAKTEEYLNQVASHKNAEQLFDKIMALKIPRLREQQVHKIIDLMPTTEKDLQIVLESFVTTVNKDGIKKIVATINDFIGKPN